MNYIQSSIEENAVDDDLKRLHSNVERLKSSKEIGVKYMQMQEVIKYKVEEELEEAVKEAIEEIREELILQVTNEVTHKVTAEVEEKMAQLTGILLKEKE